MKLNEIVLMNRDLDNHGIKISSFKNPGKSLGKIDSYEIILQTNLTDKEYKMISLVNNNKPFLMIVGSFLKHGEAFFQILQIFVEPEFRGKSLMRKVLQHIKSEWDISFISDRDLTPSGFDIWKRFKSDWKVSIFNIETKKRIPWSKENEQELFIPEIDYERVRVDKSNPLNIKANNFRLVSEDKHYLFAGKRQFQKLNNCLTLKNLI